MKKYILVNFLATLFIQSALPANAAQLSLAESEEVLVQGELLAVVGKFQGALVVRNDDRIYMCVITTSPTAQEPTTGILCFDNDP
jgi:hypothetical protein